MMSKSNVETVSNPSTSNDSFGVEEEFLCDNSLNGVVNDSNNLITKNMEEEERLIADEVAKEEEELKKQYEEKMKLEEKEQRYKRLMHLLNKSQFYASFLIKKLEQQSLEKSSVKKKKQQQQRSESNENTRTLTEKDLNVTESSADTCNENHSSSSSASKTNSNRPARKRKANVLDCNGDYNLEDYISKEDIVKRACLDSNVSKSDDRENENPVCNTEENQVVDNNTAKTRINSFGLEVSVDQPYLLEGGILRDYQLEGVEWLKLLYENGMNGILADEMGLGKTIQVIAYICFLVTKGIQGPHLIVAPLSTLSNWVLEFERFAPQIPVVLFHGTQAERRSLYHSIRKLNKVGEYNIKPVVITSYEIPLKECKFMSQINWNYIIVDEGHRLKNAHCLLSRVLRVLPSQNRLLLTGTPLQNDMTELWSLLNFILPELFDDLSTFEMWFDVVEMEKAEVAEKIIEQEREQKVISTLHQILNPFLLRRVKADIVLGIPPKKEVMVYCPMTRVQMELYKCVVDKTIKNLTASVEVNSPRRTPRRRVSSSRSRWTDAESPSSTATAMKMNEYFPLDTMPACMALTKRLKKSNKNYQGFINRLPLQNTTVVLKHIVNHPYLVRMPFELNEKRQKIMHVTEDLKVVSGKMLVLDAMLAKLKERGHKVLLFCTSTMMLDLLEEFVILSNYRYVRLDGRTKIYDRKNDIYDFNTNDEIFIFLLTNRAGGLGINLVGADTVIMYNSDWNPQVDIQAQDRAHRIGQTKPVVVYRFNVAGTVDEKIINRASSKRKLEKIVMKRGSFGYGKCNEAFELQELRELLETTDTHQQMQSNGLVFSDKELEALLDRSDMIEIKDINENDNSKLNNRLSSSPGEKRDSEKNTKKMVYQVLKIENSK